MLTVLNYQRWRQYQDWDMPKNEYDLRIRLALRELLMSRPGSRAQVADELTHRLGRNISESTLTNWASDSKQGYRVPADVVAAFCDDRLLQSLMSDKQLAKFELGEWDLKHWRQTSRQRELRAPFSRRAEGKGFEV
jgi:hypothetical protein